MMTGGGIYMLDAALEKEGAGWEFPSRLSDFEERRLGVQITWIEVVWKGIGFKISSPS